MIEPTRPLLPRLALLLLLLASLVALALTGARSAAGAIAYTKESLAEYEHQLASGQIREVTINKFVRSVRVTLKDGSHVLATYPPKQEPTVDAKLRAKAVPVTILAPTVAQAEAKSKPVHHKLRYIAGGILVAAIIIVAAVLLVNRRRRAAME
jgi:hypothetical protein